MILKRVKIIIALLGMTLLFTACPNHEEVYIDFYVKNATTSPIFIKVTGLSYDRSGYIIQPNNRICFVENGAEEQEIEYDDNYNYFSIIKIYGSSDSVVVSIYASDSTTLLKSWNKHFVATDTNKQFFRESDWSYKTYQVGTEIFHEWTFTITDNDLQ